MNRKVLALTLMLVVIALVGNAVAQDDGPKDRSQDIQRAGAPYQAPLGTSPFCSQPGSPIDSGLPAVMDVINVADNFVITDLNVQVDITHTFLADLEISVTNGVDTVDLIWDDCGSNDDMSVTFDDSAGVIACATPTVGSAATTTNNGPQEFLSVFNGQNINGNWTLTVNDDAGGDTGTLDQWCLITTPVPVELKGFEVE